MASWRRHCSSRIAPRTEHARGLAATLLAAMLLAAGCGNAREPLPADGRTGPESAATADAPRPALPDAAELLCTPAPTGGLQARLQGAIEAELDWGESVPQCQGGLRPDGDGLRLLFKGTTPDGGPLLLVFGLAKIQPGESARNVATNVTVVLEGTGQFFATQGEDKCAFDSVEQVPIEDQPGLFRLAGRGYCTQPARAVAGDGAVFLPRFDVVALVPGTDPAAAVDPPAPEVQR